MPAAPDRPDRPFGVAVTVADATATAVVTGDIDAHAAQVLDDALDEALQSGVREVVLDIGEVAFVDTSGLQVLVRAKQRLEGAGGSLRVVRVSPSVRDLLEMTGLVEELGADEGPA